MRLRLELFVADVAASVRFYTEALGFELERLDGDYAHLRRGDAELGLASIEMLPQAGDGGGFTRESVARGRGAGVEIVLEVESLPRTLDAIRTAGYS